MDAISTNGVRLSLDMDVDDGTLTTETDKITDAGIRLDEGAQELLDGVSELADHNAELMDGARQIIDAVFQIANDTLTQLEDAFSTLGISLTPLTTENYAQEIARLQRELLEKVDDYDRDPRAGRRFPDRFFGLLGAFPQDTVCQHRLRRRWSLRG